MFSTITESRGRQPADTPASNETNQPSQESKAADNTPVSGANTTPTPEKIQQGLDDFNEQVNNNGYYNKSSNVNNDNGD
ncbi:MAG: hypothetical protein LBE78_01890 [Burkholderiaceae bacterium]|jgi:hypothetical protein|nr:hypothetical protein [Burkholderiaceae bacterium]